MIDYSYVECTSACMTSLAEFAHAHPQHRSAEIASVIMLSHPLYLHACDVVTFLASQLCHCLQKQS